MARIKGKRQYTNGEITVFWDAELCYHSRNCFKNLPAVFNTKQTPWVNVQAAPSQEIAETVSKCPSGALTYKWNKDLDNEPDPADAVTIELRPNGPIRVTGNFIVTNEAGEQLEKKQRLSFCRCGFSKKYPLCDGSHKRIKVKNDD